MATKRLHQNGHEEKQTETLPPEPQMPAGLAASL
jgi:hypothetical protein